MEKFGEMPGGDPVHRVTLRGGGMTARVLSFGAVLQDLRLDGHEAPLTLGFEQFEHYLRHSRFFGATAGQYANRIAHGRFSLDGEEYRLDRNNNGHCLHGGKNGFSERLWQIEEQGEAHAVLRLDSPHGAMGFPGNVTARCRYELAGEGEFRVTLSAVTDAPTVCAMAHHSYFNLEDGGAGDILSHSLQVEAEHYLPVDDTLVPPGCPARVSGSPFDFRQAKRIDSYAPQPFYDHNFCLADGRGAMRHAATVSAAKSGVRLDIETTEPGLQFYVSDDLDVPVPGLGGRRYGNYAGMCLETQIWPDAPNNPDFPSAVLRPGETLEQRTVYRFSSI